MRRRVFVTPKSYLSFIDLYKVIYKDKYDKIDIEEGQIIRGLEKLAEASKGVEELKIDLKVEEVKLKEASEATDKLLKELEIENRKAKEKNDEVTLVATNCKADAKLIGEQKDSADQKLQAAIPHLEAAKRAVDSIKPGDITELKGMKQPSDTCRMIMDTVHILFKRALDPIKARELLITKKPVPHVMDSYDTFCQYTLKSNTFLQTLLDFSNNQRDSINEETIELLTPYLELKFADGNPVFVGDIAKVASNALRGMCDWAAAMKAYHVNSKIVKPMLRELEIKMA
jgi:dynein heavy chain